MLGVKTTLAIDRAPFGIGNTDFENLFDHLIRVSINTKSSDCTVSKATSHALAFAGFVIGIDKHDRAAAFTAFEAALAVSPSSALTFILGGLILAFGGEAERAIEWADRALRLSPFDPWRSTAFISSSLGHYHSGRFEEASTSARRAIQSAPRYSMAYAVLAAPLVKLGRLEEAKMAAARALELQPTFRCGRHYAASGYISTLAASLSEALQAAGLPG
jgi:tetratricopeptide (TPR) repeat protein